MYRRPYRILIADDDPAVHHQTTTLLKRRDYLLVTAWTLEDAYARVAAQPVDLVIAGTRVGSLSGLQFIVSCRARRPELTGILLASDRNQIPEMEAWRHGITPILLPLDAEQFLMTVAEKLAAIRRRQRWPRKRVQADVPVNVSGAPGRLLDVSYGGLRLEMAGENSTCAPTCRSTFRWRACGSTVSWCGRRAATTARIACAGSRSSASSTRSRSGATSSTTWPR